MTEAPLGFIGVDGGATRCRVRVRDSEGRALAEALGASANVHVDFAASIAAARSVVGDALHDAGLAPADHPRLAIGLGLAGVNDKQDAAASRRGVSGLSARSRRQRRGRRPASALTRGRTAAW